MPAEGEDAADPLGPQLRRELLAVRDRAARGVEHVALHVVDDLDDVRVAVEGFIDDGHCQHGAVDAGIGLQGRGHRLDDVGAEQRLVGLHVDHHIVVGQIDAAKARRLGDPVQGAGMGVGGHQYRDVPGLGEFPDLLVAGGQEQAVPALEEFGPEEAVLDQGAAEDGMQGLSGKPAGTHAGGDDTDDFHGLLIPSQKIMYTKGAIWSPR